MKRPDAVPFSLLLLLLFSANSRTFGQAVSAPPGWTSSQQGTSWTYKPTSLAKGDVFTLLVEAPQPLNNKDLVSWLAPHIKADEAHRGTIEKNENLPGGPGGIGMVARTYRDANQHSWMVVYLAFPLSGERALYCQATSNLPESKFGDLFHAGGKVCGQIARNAEPGTPRPR